MPRAVALLLASFALAGFQDDAEISRWIDELGHEEIARREAAQAALLKAGERALPELRKALASKDAEKMVRVRTLILMIDRPERERLHDAQERKRVLNLHTVDFKNEKAPEVLKKLRELLKSDLAGDVDPEARVTLSAKDETLRKILDAIEDQAECTILWRNDVWRVLSTRLPRKPRAYVPGTVLDLTCKPFEVDGKVKGIRIKAAIEGTSSPFIHTWEAQGKDGTPRNVVRCDSCGPLYALVETEGEELRIRIKGRIQWNSHYEFQAASPEVPESFLVGAYGIRYEYPKVVVTAPEPTELYRFPYAELVGTYKKGRMPDSVFGGRFAASPRPEKKRVPGIWCDCDPGPKRATPDPKLLTFREYKGFYGSQPASDFESMKIMVRKPIQEPFDTEAVIPAD